MSRRGYRLRRFEDKCLRRFRDDSEAHSVRSFKIGRKGILTVERKDDFTSVQDGNPPRNMSFYECFSKWIHKIPSFHGRQVRISSIVVGLLYDSVFRLWFS